MIGCPLEQMNCKFSGSKSTAYPQDLSTAFSMQQIAVFCSGAEFLCAGLQPEAMVTWRFR